MSEINVMQQFYEFLMQAFDVVQGTLASITFKLDSAAFSLLDLSVYSAVIGGTLSWIHAHFSGAGYGRMKSVSHKSTKGE